MKIRFFIVIAVFAVAILCFGGATQVKAAANCTALSSVNDQISCLQQVIADLLQQVVALQAQQGAVTPTTWCHTFNTNLGFANSGITEVGDLKTALIKNGVWPYQAVTYNYDGETAAYVVKFQTRYGILPSGYVGPLTRAKLNALYGCALSVLPLITNTTENTVFTTTPGQAHYAYLSVSTDKPATCKYSTSANIPYGYSSTPVLSSTFGYTGGTAHRTLVAWPPESTASSITYYVRCRDAAGNTNTVDSPVTFTFSSTAQPSITVTSPNGGEVWAQGQTVSITWSSTGIPSNGNIYISLVNDTFGKQYGITTTIGNSGSYSWTIPSTINYDSTIGSKFKISATYSPSYTPYTDLSNNYFSIVAPGTPSVTILSPNGGETYKNNGSTITVNWKTENVPSTFRFDLIRLRGYPNGPEYNLFAYDILNDGQEVITIPSNVPVGSYTLEIKAYLNNVLVMDSSDSYFKIVSATQPSITVTSPNGGEAWKVGETHNITWNSTGLNSKSGMLQINYSSTSIYSNSIATVPVLSGSYSWTIPSNFVGDPQYNNKYSIGITCYDCTGGSGPNGWISDYSNSYFTIVASTTPACTDSDGGINYNNYGVVTYGGYNYADWCSTNGGNGGQVANCSGPNCTLIENYCDSTSGGTNYKSYVCPNGCSNGVCSQTTAQPSITVTSPNGGEAWKVGETHNITWNSSAFDSNAKISISLFDNFTSPSISWLPIASGVPNTGSYTWIIPASINVGNNQPIPTNGSHRIEMDINGNVNGVLYGAQDFSNNYFAIIAPTTATCTDSDGGKDYYVKGSVTETSQYSSWKPSIFSDMCVDDTSLGNLAEAICEKKGDGYYYGSQTYYTCPNGCLDGACVATPVRPSVTILSPNGGETFRAVQNMNISWKITGTAQANTLKLYLSDYTNGSVPIIHTLAMPYTGDQPNYTYNIPMSMSPGSKFKVGIEWWDGKTLLAMDLSNNYFTITPPMVSAVQQGFSASILDAMPSWLKLIFQGYEK